MIEEAIKEVNLDNVIVDYTEGLTVEYAKNKGAYSIVRGLRAVTDFEYEFQMSAVNKNIDKNIDMVFLWQHLILCLFQVAQLKNFTLVMPTYRVMFLNLF